ncbi:hypothetical protein [Methanobrevibacter arboriphilus]|uniref:Uncharacterized protein n=1 Tax=Methanobrevibacter arboriphilus TaxID=39441 RepID=A0ACA8R4P5_METAZ|nr:hypothetical protein [Methanobrevibacter arboriphilus]BBL62645.1 hypothetical protein MarbSA_16850 [Methanobrevibacter arboriphilus]
MNSGWIVIGIAIIAIVGVIGISYLNYEMNTITSDEINEELNNSNLNEYNNTTKKEFVEKMQDFQEDNERYANENQIPDYIGDV